MINENYAKKFCRDEISKIENYDKAMADPTQTWDCHHRLELTLDGEFAHTREELKRLDMYYKRPYFELIFLTKAEHRSLHRSRKGSSAETRRRIAESHKGRTFSEEHRKKLSESHKGRTFSEVTRHKISTLMKGKNKGRTHSEETRQKISEASKRQWERYHKSMRGTNYEKEEV